jgi:hypothetical protein
MICSGVYPFFGISIPPFLRYYIWYRFRGSGQYLSYPGGTNTRFEVDEGLDKNIISSWGFSLHELFVSNRALFEGAYLSLKKKLALIADSSKALLEAALGERITKLITARLLGEDVSADIRNILDEHLREIMLVKVVPRVRMASYTITARVLTNLGMRKDDNFSWEYEQDDQHGCFNLQIKWRSLQYGYQDHDEHMWLIHQEVQDFCVRDAFLLSINLDTLGEQISTMIERISHLGA